MSQQHHDLGYLDYSSSANRSPGSRQNYAGGASFASGLSLPRQAHRPFDASVGSSALYPTERIPAGFNPRALDSMAAAGMHGGYMLDNGQAWNYSTAGVATVNGAMHGSNRQRSVNRRAALPQVCPSRLDNARHRRLTLPDT